jgi:hypothetical protein
MSNSSIVPCSSPVSDYSIDPFTAAFTTTSSSPKSNASFSSVVAPIPDVVTSVPLVIKKTRKTKAQGLTVESGPEPTSSKRVHPDQMTNPDPMRLDGPTTKLLKTIAFGTLEYYDDLLKGTIPFLRPEFMSFVRKLYSDGSNYDLWRDDIVHIVSIEGWNILLTIPIVLPRDIAHEYLQLASRIGAVEAIIYATIPDNLVAICRKRLDACPRYTMDTLKQMFGPLQRSQASMLRETWPQHKLCNFTDFKAYFLCITEVACELAASYNEVVINGLDYANHVVRHFPAGNVTHRQHVVSIISRWKAKVGYHSSGMANKLDSNQIQLSQALWNKIVEYLFEQEAICEITFPKQAVLNNVTPDVPKTKPFTPQVSYTAPTGPCRKCNEPWVKGHRCKRFCERCKRSGHATQQCRAHKKIVNVPTKVVIANSITPIPEKDSDTEEITFDFNIVTPTVNNLTNKNTIQPYFACIDSGATKSIFSNTEFFLKETLRKENTKFSTLNSLNTALQGTHTGTVCCIIGNKLTVRIEEAIFAPKAGYNLIATRDILSESLNILLSTNGCEIVQNAVSVLIQPHPDLNLYMVPVVPLPVLLVFI